VYRLKTFFYLITYLAMVSYASAQTVIDSLTQQLKTAKGENRFETLFQLAYEYSDVNDQLSLTYSKEAYELALGLGDSTRIVRAGRITAGELRRTDRIDEAISLAEYVLKISKRHNINSETKFLLNSLAISYSFKAEYDKALKLNLESLVIREADGNKKEISITLNNIGYNYYKLYNYDNAITYYKRSIELKKKEKDSYDLDRGLINLGLAYNAKGNYEEAKKYINEGLLYCKGNCADQIVMEGEFGLGSSFFDSHLLSDSEPHFKRAYEVAKKINNIQFQVECLLFFSKFEINRKKFDQALNYLKEAESISKSSGFRLLQIKSYASFYSLYDQLGDYKNKSLYQGKYIELKDSVLNANIINNLTKIQTNYAERENLKTIKEKNQLVTLQKEIIKRQERQYYFITLIVCLVGALAFLSFYFLKRQQKSNQALRQAKAWIEQQNHNLEERVAERTKDLVQANDDMDYFIYKTSHDLRGPLVTLKGMCNVAHLDLKDQLALSYFSKFDQTVDRLNVILTRLQIVNHINSSELIAEQVNFQNIINDIWSFEKKKGLPPRFSFTYEIQPGCHVKADSYLVKIVLENLIDNAVKYYNNSERVDPFVKMVISCDEELAKITIEDNGIGINLGAGNTKDIFRMFVRASERSEIGGLGLYLARLATEKLGGKIGYTKSVNHGSIFQVVIPAHPPHSASTQNNPDLPPTYIPGSNSASVM